MFNFPYEQEVAAVLEQPGRYNSLGNIYCTPASCKTLRWEVSALKKKC